MQSLDLLYQEEFTLLSHYFHFPEPDGRPNFLEYTNLAVNTGCTELPPGLMSVLPSIGVRMHDVSHQ